MGGESMSIQTQKAMLKQYADDKDFVNCEYFVDDGYSGTNFNRPDFQRMVSLVEQGKVGTVIVKDLSRLGRNYLVTGNNTEVIFPEYKVRFIAINDGVDTANGDNEFAPFKNIINEWYAKDASRKTKSAFRTKALKGEYTGGFPAYGYMKDPADRHHLIPDANAPIVKQMFQMALEGETTFHIAKYLEKNKIPTPRAYIMNEFGKYQMNSLVKHPYSWAKGTVLRILQNPIYTGKLVSLRYQTRSFKDKRIAPRPEEEWITVEDTHEALVDQATWDIVQERISVKKPVTWANSDNKYRGLIWCAECQTRMVFTSRRTEERRSSIGYFCCNKFRRYGKGENSCSAHYISYEQIEGILMTDLQAHAALLKEDKYVQLLLDMAENGQADDRKATETELQHLVARQEELDVILNQLYEDHALHRIPDDRYLSLSNKYSAEYQELKTAIAERLESKIEFNQKEKMAKTFADLVEKYTDFEELSSGLLNTLIDKVVVHEKEKTEKGSFMKVDIFYRFIGKIDSDPEKAIKIGNHKALIVIGRTKKDLNGARYI